MHARTVAQLYSTLRLVERNVILCKAAETARRLGGIAGKSTGGLSAAPAARIFQRLGQFPVVQCDIRLQARSAAGLEHAQIKRKPFPVPAAVAVRVHPRPAHAETVSTEAHLRRAGNVLLISAVRVRGGGTVKPVCNGAGAAAEYVPNGFPAAVGPRAALGLVSAGGRAPYKIFCKRHMSPRSAHRHLYMYCRSGGRGGQNAVHAGRAVRRDAFYPFFHPPPRCPLRSRTPRLCRCA